MFSMAATFCHVAKITIFFAGTSGEMIIGLMFYVVAKEQAVSLLIVQSNCVLF